MLPSFYTLIAMPAHRKEYPEAIRMYEKGLSVQDVAEFYGVSRQSMWTWLKLRNVRFRDRVRRGEENHFHRNGPTSEKRAHRAVDRAIKKGIIQRPSNCDRCGRLCVSANNRPQIEAHHEDYAKPLDVQWLCRSCHFKRHAQTSPLTCSSADSHVKTSASQAKERG